MSMPRGEGRIVCCDTSEEWTAIAREYWAEAGVHAMIDLILAPAAETLEALVLSGAQGAFDFAFIDADKRNCGLYFEECLKLVRRGGLIAIDNALWGGKVADPADLDPDTVAIRRLIERLHTDERVEVSFLAVGDGLYLARKR
jgi:predicted O-methyltransferase YrrM